MLFNKQALEPSRERGEVYRNKPIYSYKVKK